MAYRLFTALRQRGFWQISPRDTCMDQRQWRRDPLSHPDLRQMSQRELGDLPFDPWRIGRN